MRGYIDPIKEKLASELESLKIQAEQLKISCDEEKINCDGKIETLVSGILELNEEISKISITYNKIMVLYAPCSVLLGGIIMLIFSKLFTLFGVEAKFAMVNSCYIVGGVYLPICASCLMRICKKYSKLELFKIKEIDKLNLKIIEYQRKKSKVVKEYDDFCLLIKEKENELANLDNVNVIPINTVDCFLTGDRSFIRRLVR